MPQYKTKMEFIRGTIGRITTRHNLGGTNSIQTCKNIASDIEVFLNNVMNRNFPNNIEDYVVVCDERNNRCDRGKNIVAHISIRDDCVWHSFNYTLLFDTGPIDQFLDHSNDIDDIDAFDRAMKGI